MRYTSKIAIKIWGILCSDSKKPPKETGTCWPVGKLKDADLQMLGFHGFSMFYVNLLEDIPPVWYFEPSRFHPQVTTTWKN